MSHFSNEWQRNRRHQDPIYARTLWAFFFFFLLRALKILDRAPEVGELSFKYDLFSFSYRPNIELNEFFQFNTFNNNYWLLV